jgi:CxC2 like cysteine cluster associated with KDZ transposases
MHTQSASLGTGRLSDLADHPHTVNLPSEPEGISDTLFDVDQASLNNSETASRRVRTAKSGNPLLTVVHQSGVFDMELLFCACPNAGPRDEQLLQSRLFPSSFKYLETAFTLSVLEDFLTDNLECKTTAQQYYSKIQSTTNRMFPDSVPVCSYFYISAYIWVY